ncbi:MAG: hypothetical protein GWP08_03160 [Nitrospiraceae bacterium]|nr:hypothetical protein [Nitrospiraceae bacterium]
MTQAETKEYDVPDLPDFPEYGGSGDKAGARRMRRAFRFCVAASILLTTALYVVERYLRYDLAESQYLMSLTLPTESARPVLRQVVKRDAERREAPTPKYVAALAEREERDLVLPTYERAYKLDPSDSFLAVRYGCQLFFHEDYEAARERFREAGVQPPKNALPYYLQAAALAMDHPGEAGLADSLALVAKTNEAGDPVLFPEPLWSGDLPKGGVRHNNLRREIVIEACAPLFRYADVVVGRAKSQIVLKQVQYLDSWLAILQTLGERLAASRDEGSLQMLYGIDIQLMAIEQRQAICEAEQGTVPAALVERRTRLKSALAMLKDFEAKRDARIAAARKAFELPLGLCWRTAVVLLATYLLVYVLAHLSHAKRMAWSLPHTLSAKIVLGAGNLALLGLLGVMAVLQRLYDPMTSTEASWQEGMRTAWWVVVGAMMLFGLVYPALRLLRVNGALRSREVSEQDAEARGLAKRWRRVAYFSFMRRYYGIAGGMLVFTLAGWIVGYRVLTALYPWQLELLTPGLEAEEVQLVKQAFLLLKSGL